MKMNDAKIKGLLKEYTKIIDKLKEGGIIRSSKLVADYGEYLASKKLKLTLEKNPTNKGHDAIDSKGKKYEIKTRKEYSWNIPTRINFKANNNADFLVYVGLDNEWGIKDMLVIPKKEIKPRKGSIILNKELKKRFRILKP